jgi:hypothetical protein
MTIKNLRYSFILLALCAFAGTVAAQDRPAVATPTTTSSLEMGAEVQTTLQLNITGPASVSGDNATGLFNVAFGTVNALGLGTPATGVTEDTSATGTLYKSEITLTPVFTGFGVLTADIQVEAGTSTDQSMAREGATLSGTGGTAPTTTPGAAIITGKATGVGTTREVGMFVAKTQVAGVKVATLIYTVTVD